MSGKFGKSPHPRATKQPSSKLRRAGGSNSKSATTSQTKAPPALDSQTPLADAEWAQALERVVGPGFQEILDQLVFPSDRLKAYKRARRLYAAKAAAFRGRLERWRRNDRKGPEPVQPTPPAEIRAFASDTPSGLPDGWPPKGWKTWPVPKTDTVGSILAWFRFYLVVLPHQADSMVVNERTVLADVSAIIEDTYRLVRFLARRNRMAGPLLSPRLAKEAKRSADAALFELERLERWIVEAQTNHSADFTAVKWKGIKYEFSKAQATAVEMLWQEWEKGGLSLSEKTIGERIGTSNDNYRLTHTFRVGRKMHPAWKTMIVSSGQGKFRLSS